LLWGVWNWTTTILEDDLEDDDLEDDDLEDDDLEDDDLEDDDDDDFPFRLIIVTCLFWSRSFAGDNNSRCWVVDVRGGGRAVDFDLWDGLLLEDL
jgi:hypothetical protein